MKSFLLTALFVGIISFSFAAEKENKSEAKVEKTSLTTISGQVVDKTTEELLVGVKVTLEGTDEVVYTDFDGNYSFENIKIGNYKLTASYISYEKASVNDVQVSLNKNQVDFSLEITN